MFLFIHEITEEISNSLCRFNTSPDLLCVFWSSTTAMWREVIGVTNHPRSDGKSQQKYTTDDSSRYFITEINILLLMMWTFHQEFTFLYKII